MCTLLVVFFDKVCILCQMSKCQCRFPTFSINSTVKLMLADVRMQRRECHLLSDTEIKCSTELWKYKVTCSKEILFVDS